MKLKPLDYNALLWNRLVQTYFVLLILLQSTFSYGQDLASLEQVVQQALKNNPTIQISALDVENRKGFLQSAEGQFNPALDFGISQSNDVTPNTYITREGVITGVPSESYNSFLFNYNLGVSKRFKTGLWVRPSLSLNNYGKDLNYDFLKTNGFGDLITNRGNLSMSATQPLLKGRGAKYYRATLDVQKLNLSASELNYINNSSAQIMNVIGAYLNYLSNWNSLEIQRSVQTNYQKFASQLKELADKEVIPQVELLFIQSNLTSQMAIVNQAEGRFVASRNALAEVMGMSIDEYEMQLPGDTKFFVESISEPDSVAYVSFWLKKALENRGDYLASLKQVESTQVNLGFAENDNQPQLDLNLGVGYNGIFESGSIDQYIAPFYSNIPGVNYYAGINFTLPMGRDATKGRIQSALAAKTTAEQRKRRTELSIKQNVSSTFYQVMTLSSAVEAIKESVELSKKSIENEYLKLKLGLSAVTSLVQVQRAYALSQSNLNNYLYSLNLAVIQHRFHTGTLIQASDDGALSVNLVEVFTLPPIAQ